MQLTYKVSRRKKRNGGAEHERYDAYPRRLSMSALRRSGADARAGHVVRIEQNTDLAKVVLIF